MKFDTSAIRKAVKALADNTRRAKPKIVRQAARGFVKTVIEITPPASKGVNGSAAKKAGETTVLNDVLKLVIPAIAVGRGGRAALATRATLLQVHAAARRGVKGGRVNPRNRQKLFMVPSDIAAVVRALQGNVGILAGGWNKAAARLGVSVPAWIKRHGSAAGVVKIEEFGGFFRITVGNAVKFVDDVDGYDKRIQASLDIEGAKMQRQAAFLLADARRKAGF